MNKLIALSLLCAVFLGVRTHAQIKGMTARPTEAGKYGCITGEVSVVGTHEPLPGAIVRVLGTGLIATVDSSGEYAIFDVPIGAHTVLVRKTGYKQYIRNVTVDTSGLTRCSFMIRDTLSENVFHAWPRWMVHPDRTSSRHFWTEEEINKLPGH